ncbi:MAG: glycosyltransferase family 2 protein, partial [Candidatus Margulisiibacteriota bacterium]
MSSIDLSVVIVHYNTPDLLCQCIQSIQAYTREVSYEVIVVDNASSLRVEPTHLQGVHWIQSAENLGFGRANNVGAKQAKGKYLLLLNSDTLLINNLLLALYQEACSRERFGIIAPRLLNPDHSTQLYGSVMGWWQYKGTKSSKVSFVSGAAMLIPRELFLELGGFDERFFFYNEDVDLCKTIRRRGYPIFYEPLITVIHFGGQSTRKSLRLQLQAFRSSWYFFKKHYLSFMLCIIFSYTFASSELKLYKVPSAESITFESYTVLPGEQMGVGGFLYQRFITPE